MINAEGCTNTLKRLFIVICLSHLGLISNTLFAGDNQSNNPNNITTSIQLEHRIIVRQIIYLRVGDPTPMNVDKVTIDIGNSPSFNSFPVGNNNQTYSGAIQSPLGNGNSIAATNNGVLPVVVWGNVGTVTLGYEVDNVMGLTDGLGNFINYDQIEVVSDNSDLPAPELSNTGGISGGSPPITVDILGNFFGGKVVKRTANWTFSYKNQTTPVAGTYAGRVTYTAVSP